jgi:hypothetical protein
MTLVPTEHARLPDLDPLTESERERVRRRLAEGGFRCGACGGDEFGVGDAVYLGFLFLSEETDAYMIGLTCANPRCPAPHTGIRMHERELRS